MKQKVKDILAEMVNLGEGPFEKVYLKQAYEELGFEEVYDLVKWILHWQKNIYNKNVSAPFEDFQEDKFLLEEAHQRRYPKFYQYVPELNEVFTLHPNKITYNENLTEDEKHEILKYIDNNHTIMVRKRRVRK